MARHKPPVGFAAVIACSLAFAASALCADGPNETTPSTPRVSAVKQFTHDGAIKTDLLSDDSHLYVTESQQIVKFAVESGKRTSVATGFPKVHALDVSADGSRLLIRPIVVYRNTELWTLQNGKSEKIASIAAADAAWSADGQKLVFSKDSSLYMANADGSDAKQIFSGESSIFTPRFSPDGKRVRFSISNTAQNTTSIWEVGVDGSNAHAVLNGWSKASTACCGSWSADGRYFIFQSTQTWPTTLTTLWALPEGESVPFQLTNGPISFGNVTPARDGKLWALGVQPQGEPVKYDPRSGKMTPILEGISGTDLEFSPDGKWVTYISVPDAILWRCKTDGSDRVQLTQSPERTALPQWSPDGKQIAYVSMEPGKPWKIALISRDGGKPTTMFEENRSQIDANWSADGKRIMFGYLHDEQSISIRIIDLKTHEVTSIPGSEGLFSPRWSPDGRYIAALSPDYTKVQLFDFQTGKWTNWLTEPAGAVSYPSWSADSKYLYFDDLVTDEESIRRVKVGENQAEHVFTLNIERYPGPFGLWSGRTNDGSWLFIRDHSSQEVYQLSVVLP